MKRKLLLLSNSTNYGHGWLEHAEEPIQNFLGSSITSAVFIPYAGVTFSFDKYAERAAGKFNEWGIELDSIHQSASPGSAVENANAIIIGGGNTFYLVYHLQENNLIEVIRKKVRAGIPYMGWSAGANVACPGLMTTNDMPIIQPESFNTLNLVPFQINPHYIDMNPEQHKGETREVRILEFLEINKARYVLGLREGSILKVFDDNIELLGEKSVRVFKYGCEAKEYEKNDSLEFLLNS